MAQEGNGFPARTDHQVLAHNGSLFVIGGRQGINSSSTHYNDVWRSTDGGTTWTEIAETNFTPARQAFGAAVLNGSLYIMGGRPSGSATRLGDIWGSADGGVEWLSVGVLTNARSGFALEALDGKLYAIGGLTASSSNSRIGDVESFTAEEPAITPSP